MGDHATENQTSQPLSPLEALPSEALLVILSSLDLRTLSQMRSASRKLRALIDANPKLWLMALRRETDVRYYDTFINQNPLIKGPGGSQQSLIGWARQMPQFIKHNALIDTAHIERPLREPVTGHTNKVCALAVLPDGHLASSSFDMFIKIWDPATGKRPRTLIDHTSQLRALAVLPDGKLASGSDDKTIKIWNPITEECLRTLEGHESYVRALAVLPSGNLASGSDDKTIKIWNPATGQCLRTLTGHAEWVRALGVLPDGNLASSSDDNTIKIWNPVTGQCLRTLTNRTRLVSKLAALSNGTLASTDHKNIKFWSSATGECLRTFQGHADWVDDLAVLPDGNLVSSSFDKTIKIWDPLTGACLQTLALESEPLTLVYQDGALYAGFINGTIQRFDFAKIDLTQTTDETLADIRTSRNARPQ